MLPALSLRREAAGRSQRFLGCPSFRVDLKREIDLIEEVARLYGVDKILLPRRAARLARTLMMGCTIRSPKPGAS